MPAKKKQAEKKTSHILSDVFNRSIEVISDLASTTTATSMNASLTSAHYLVRFQKSSAKAGLDLISKVQDYSEKTLRKAMKEADWAPDEGKEVVDEWAKMMGSGIDEFSRVIDKSFDLVLKLIERVEKKKAAKLRADSDKTSSTPKKAKTKAKAKAKAKTTTRRKPAARKKSAASS